MLRKFLIRLRAEFEKDSTKYYLLSSLTLLVLSVITLVVDLTLPFEGYSNILRSALLLPTAITGFVLFYGIGLRMHYDRVERDDTWIPYRARFSPSWRRRIAVVVGAVLIVVAQAVTEQVGYTLVSSIIGSAVIATFAFIRRSKEEIQREELGIPDARDIMYDAQKRQIEREQKLKAAAKESKKKKKSSAKDLD